MSRVLYAWELGGGTGHLHTLAMVRDLLEARGHEVWAAVRDPAAAERVLGERARSLLPAPFWSGGAGGLPASANYAEVLLRCGYASPESLRGLVKAWLGLFEAARPAVLVAEHSPTALLAARVAGLPAIALGTGFTLPARAVPMEPLQPWQRLPRQRLESSEAAVLDHVNRAVAPLGAAPLGAVADLFDLAAGYLCTFAELDHYRARRDGLRYWGPLGVPPPAQPPVWPCEGEARIFVYMHPNYGHFLPLVQHLAGFGWPMVVVAPGIAEGRARALSSATTSVVGRPLDLAAVAARADVVVTHCGHGTACEVLRHGCPLVLVPTFVEQAMLAARVANAGLGLIALAEDERPRYGERVDDILADPSYRRRCAAFAERYRGFDPVARRAELGDDLAARVRALAG